MPDSLIDAAQHGDRAAFEELILPRVRGLFALAALALHDRVLAEDAVQDALIRSWRSLPSLRNHDRFDVWLRRLLMNSCIDAARTARRHRSVGPVPAEIHSRIDFESAVANRDALERAFTQLSVRHRVVFVLRHYESRTLPEIAEACRIPLGTAKSRLYHAERSMAQAMMAADAAATQGEPA